MAGMERLLFVGIGGTGGKVGLHLEHKLRELLCGPGGDELKGISDAFSHLVPYQLPDFVRSIYIDLDGDVVQDLTGGSLGATPQATAGSRQVLQNLMPPPRSYPEVAACLRAGATEAVAEWLPPRLSEPRVSPLSAGAGQFPTVGRAALYEMLRSKGAESTLFQPFQSVVGQLDAADRQLRALNGSSGYVSDKCNVYVAFSLAGGTGCGLFLDVLHLIEHSFDERTRLKPIIHPLVAMPSSFDAQRGGGSPARLNAASAIVDLARYIDNQNTGGRDNIVFPDGKNRTVRASTQGKALAPTAYIFSRPQTHGQDDHIRVMATFVGAKVAPTSDIQVQADLNHHQSGVNRATKRSEPSPQGIGRHPFTMAYSGALSVPDAELSRVLAESILASAVAELQHGTEPLIPDSEILGLLRDHSGLVNATDREIPDRLDRIKSDRGASKVRKAANSQRGKAETNMDDYREAIAVDMPSIARLDWRRALEVVVDKGADPFQLARVVGANPSEDSEHTLRKVIADIDRTTDTVSERPPPVPELRDRLGPFGFAAAWLGMKPNNAKVTSYNKKLNAWQQDRANQIWKEAWERQRAELKSDLEQLEQVVELVRNVLIQETYRADTNADQTFNRTYERRQGVVNYIPQSLATGGLSRFRDEALDRIYQAERLNATSNSGAAAVRIVHKLGYWKQIGAAAGSGRKAAMIDAINDVKADLASRIGRILGTADFHHDALLPSLAELLQWAADGGAPSKGDLPQRITDVLASVLASATDINLEPSHIVVSYPAAGIRDSDAVESFLRRLLDQAAPASAGLTIQRSQSADLVVTVIRSEVPLLEVPEARKCIVSWDDALRTPSRESRLWWRQRSGWDTYCYLTSAEDHTQILFAILNGLWSGIVVPEKPTGNSMVVSIQSPKSIQPEYSDILSGVEIRLELVRPPIDELSFWSGLISALEHFVVHADEPEMETLSQWMAHIPAGVTRTDSRDLEPAAAPYWEFLDDVRSDVTILDKELSSGNAHPTGVAANLRFAHGLLTTAFSEAMQREFGTNPRFRNHQELGNR